MREAVVNYETRGKEPGRRVLDIVTEAGTLEGKGQNLSWGTSGEKV